MNLIYGRVSTKDQQVKYQLGSLSDFMQGDENETYQLYEDEGVSAVSAKPAFDRMMREARRGDTIVITELSRLDRRVIQLMAFYEELQGRGIGLTVLKEPSMSFGAGNKLSTANEAMLGMMAVFADMERKLMHERTMRGVRKAQAEGKYKGMPPNKDLADRFDKLVPTWTRTNRELAETLQCSMNYIFTRKRNAKKCA